MNTKIILRLLDKIENECSNMSSCELSVREIQELVAEIKTELSKYNPEQHNPNAGFPESVVLRNKTISDFRRW